MVRPRLALRLTLPALVAVVLAGVAPPARAAVHTETFRAGPGR